MILILAGCALGLATVRAIMRINIRAYDWGIQARQQDATFDRHHIDFRLSM